MEKATKAELIVSILKEEYPEGGSLLDYRNPFELLIALILSAQTTDVGVNKVTPRLFERYPGPGELAAARQEDVEEIIRSTGFYRVKAGNIIKTAQALTKEGGRIPCTMADLTALPGVGRKTANVILSRIFGEPAIIVDTHFKRVAKRLGFTNFTEPDKIEAQLVKVLPQRIQTDFSRTLNYHGRRYCFARRPNCGDCPLEGLCPSMGIP